MKREIRMRYPFHLSPVALAVGMCCHSGSASAATLDEMVVTGSRVEESLFELPQAGSVLTREEMEEMIYRTTPEALTHQPGVTVQKTAHGHGSPFIRGLTGPQVVILVDGVRLNNSTFRFGPNQYLNTIDPGAIERIEVIRGPSSVLYGSDALGGVINIITRKRRDFEAARDVDAEVGAVYGSADDEKTGRVSVEGNVERFGYLANGSYRDFDNLEGGGDIGEQLHTGYEEYHANLALSYKLQGGRVDLVVQQTEQMNVPRTDKFVNDNQSQIFDPQEHTSVALHWDTRVGSGLADRLKGSLSYQRQYEVLDRFDIGDTQFRHYEDDVRTTGLNLQADKLMAGSHLLSYGMEYYADDVDSSRVDTEFGVATVKRGNFPDGSEYTRLGLFLQDQIALSARSELTLGVRYDRNELDTVLVNYGAFNPDYDDISGSIRWSGLITDDTRLFASVSQGFRAPSLDDVAVLRETNQDIDAPSPNVESEHSINYELGIKVNKPRWQGTATAFWSDLDDLIERGPGTYLGLNFIDDNGNGIQDADELSVNQKFNVGEAKIYGVELDGSVRVTGAWTAYGNFTWLRGENETDNEPVSRIPPMRALLGARWQPAGSAYWVEPFVELVDNQDRLSARDQGDARIPPGGTPGYGTLNLHAGWGDGVQSLNVALNNLGDKAYKTHGSGVFGPGREIKLSYTRRF